MRQKAIVRRNDSDKEVVTVMKNKRNQRFVKAPELDISGISSTDGLEFFEKFQKRQQENLDSFEELQQEINNKFSAMKEIYFKQGYKQGCKDTHELFNKKALKKEQKTCSCNSCD